MAKVTIKSVVKRAVTVDVLWDDGLTVANHVITDVPVEDFDAALPYLQNHILGMYNTVAAAAAKVAYDNPTPDPKVLAVIGHTFDNDGNLIA